MPAFTFDQILQQGVRQGKIPGLSRDSREWFRDTANKTTNVTPRQMIQNSKRLRGSVLVGNMYAFFYDPKMKKELPYYDRFPLVFPIEKAPNGFLGINMHYLPYILRAKLMDALYQLSTNQKFDATTRLDLSYQILKGAARFKPFKPTVKRYLTSHIRSRFLYIQPNEWDIALFLPVERFQKASKQQVFKDSKNAI